MPDGICCIGAHAFWKNEMMLCVVLPSSVKTIEPYAFNDCISIKSIIFSPNLTVIGSYAFASCDALTEAVLPNKLNLIDDGGFAFCPALKKVYLSGDHVTISPSAFFMTDVKIIDQDGEIMFYQNKKLPLF